MLKILFFINSLRAGGAEKTLVNLVNNLSNTKYHITVLTLFDIGVNKQFLLPHIEYKYLFKRKVYGIKQIFKLFTPSMLHKFFIKGIYDIEIAYLQGITTRIISASKVPSIAWIHGTFNVSFHSKSYRNIKEMKDCYSKFNYVACVSESVAQSFKKCVSTAERVGVIYNTQDYNNVVNKAIETININFDNNCVNFITIGSMLKVKGYNRLLNCIKKLSDKYHHFHLYLIGTGEEKDSLEKQVRENNLSDVVTFLNFQENPYKFLARSDMFVCSSFSEGFSGTVSEATILGIPTLTTRVSGMEEILGKDNEFGIIVDNNESAIYEGLVDILEHPEKLSYYKKKVKERSLFFRTEATIKPVEDLFISLKEQ